MNWTKLSYDVFRAPPLAIVFSTLIGIGAQCIAISATVIILISFGNFLDAELRDYVYLLFFGLSAIYGSIAGYVSARLYKFFNGTNWLVSFYLTGAVVPLSVTAGLMLIDFLDWLERGRLSIAVIVTGHGKIFPQSEITFLYAIWLVANIPSVGFGSYRGFKASKIQVPVKTSRIERQVPTLE